MDLAGIDLPGRPARSSLVRRNSTAAIEFSVPDEEEMDRLDDRNDPDVVYHKLLVSAFTKKDEAGFRNLVARYRSSRTPDPFNVANASPSSADPPLPKGYSTRGYNACLEGMMRFRRRSESIAPILELYNEMLDRDCVPNGRTYQFLIEALCQRELGVLQATEDWELVKAWAIWKAEKLGTGYDEAAMAESQAIIDGYKAEGNFDSAIKLWTAFVMTRSGLGTSHIVSSLFRVASQKDLSEQDLKIIEDVLAMSEATKLTGYRRLYGDYFLILAKSGQVDQLERQWEKFRGEDLQQKYQAHPLWLPYTTFHQERQAIAENRQKTDLARSQCWAQASMAFLQVGKIDKAESIWAELRSAQDDADATKALPRGINPMVYGQYAAELIKVDVDAGLKLFLEVARATDMNMTFMEVEHLLYVLITSKRVYDLVGFLQANKFRGRLVPRQVERLIIFASEFISGDDAGRASLMVRLLRDRKVPMDLDILRSRIQAFAQMPETSDGVRQRSRGIREVFENFTNSKEPLDENGQALLLDMIKSVIDQFPFGSETSVLADQLEFLSGAADFVHIQDEEIAMAIGNRFLDASKKGTVNVFPREWQTLIDLLLGYPADQGELDETFLAVVKALPTVNGPYRDIVLELEGRAFMANFVARLLHRFGEERTLELIKPTFGEKEAEQMVRRSVPSENEAERISTLPPLPESAVPIGTTQPALTISNPLGLQVDEHTKNSRVKISPSAALAILKKGIAAGQVAHPDIIARLIDNLSREGQEKQVRYLYALTHHVIQNLLPEQEKASAWFTLENYTLVAMCHLGKLEEAGMHRARLYEAGMAPNADSYASMIACSKDTTDDALLAKQLFDESAAAGNLPTLFLYNTVISKLSKARKADLALEYFKDLKANGNTPSPVTYGAIINACCRVGDGESAATLFQEMVQQSGYKPRVPPYNTMMQFHLVNQPSRERVLYYYDVMRRNRVKPTAHTYKLLLDAYAVLPPINLQAMEKVFDDLIYDNAVRVQGTHWASVITGYGLSGDDPKKALQIFSQISNIERAHVDLRNEPVVWEAILNVLAQKGMVQELKRVANDMFASQAKVTAYVLNVLISGYARAGHMAEARAVFSQMSDSAMGVAAPNNHPQLYTSSGHVKPSSVTNEPTNVVYREPSTYEAMIKAELGAGNREAAVELLKMMEARQYPYAVFMNVKALLDEPRDQVPEANAHPDPRTSFTPESPR